MTAKAKAVCSMLAEQKVTEGNRVDSLADTIRSSKWGIDEMIDKLIPLLPEQDVKAKRAEIEDGYKKAYEPQNLDTLLNDAAARRTEAINKKQVEAIEEAENEMASIVERRKQSASIDQQVTEALAKSDARSPSAVAGGGSEYPPTHESQ